MAVKRVNITVDEDVLKEMDATASYYDMSRSELIALMYEIIDNTNALATLAELALNDYEAGHDETPAYFRPSSWWMAKASRSCHLER